MKKFLIAFIATFGNQLSLKAGDEETLTEDKMIEFMKSLAFKDDKSEIVPAEIKAAFESFQAKALETFKAEKEENKTATTIDPVAFIASHEFVETTALTALKAKETEAVTLAKEKGELETKVVSLTAKAEVGEKFLSLKKAEAIRLYKTAVGAGNEVKSVIDLFEAADDSAVDGLLKQYTKEATHKFSGKCAKCGDTEFSFQSSFSGEDPAEKTVVPTIDVSADALYEKFSNNSMAIGRSPRTTVDE